ncbi:MAG: ABC transporter permease subunit [Candidatus Marinimicrobia bacterium]|jgi:microcin C transport system permease protein|nr:ABC transporter permease subunit [Candidatus Neomarinimicrobiota bacterium]MBT3633738.1 ABC transporter permease subunit [Candidatus Neomarinimicrobiota bacterium]MBT3682530.1 ABC transporter permease subunit [Candidatus Neomarinimicrobiota bacterium]MBT3759294.1 ABC transporter permease subunit [Candidatus Neomarinimicrobiota bacterium]MBT3894698.1 ABC transporter permease subunit [Candidatus Neomarinimicrobiota bacterium]
MTNNTKSQTQEISLSILKKRWLKFKTMKRGYYSFILLIILYVTSFFLPLLINNRPVVMKFENEYFFPAISGYYPGSTFNQDVPGETNYRLLKKTWGESDSENWILMPLYGFSPYEDITVEGNKMFAPPSGKHFLGTDDTGRDVFARLCYAFNISISFALVLAILNYVIGISIGGAMGYFGGKFDLFFQRIIEIWSSLPMLFVIIIIASIVTPSFFILIFIYTIVNWIGMTYLMRAEFYREKAKDYVAAALSMGQSNTKIIFKHILPNSLVPVITFFPFAIVGYISALVGLDYLGFGLPPPTPSWGQMLSVGLQNMSKWWMVFAPVGIQFMTLLMVVFIGEGVREAFDPKVYSRLR